MSGNLVEKNKPLTPYFLEPCFVIITGGKILLLPMYVLSLELELFLTLGFYTLAEEYTNSCKLLMGEDVPY